MISGSATLVKLPRTLEGLVSKGVKVDIGIPHELWDKPSAEITQVGGEKRGLLVNPVEPRAFES